MYKDNDQTISQGCSIQLLPIGYVYGEGDVDS